MAQSTELADFVKQAHETIGNYRQPFVVSPKTLRFANYGIAQLVWNSVKFERSELKKLPNDRRGVYAFVLAEHNAVLPPHGYVVYIGIAGKDADRSLRDRCRDYLNAKRLVKERQGMAFVIGNWGEVLRLYYAPVDKSVSNTALKKLEKALNAALLPPYSRSDVEITVKKLRKAFQT